jgi:hypothetical protein
MATTDAYRLADPATWYVGTDLVEAGTKAVLLDYTRDSRDDLLLAIEAGSGIAYRGLRSTGRAFGAVALHSSSMDFDRIKLASSDVNRDGRGDIVVYAGMTDGKSGTRLYVYRSGGTAFAAGELWLEDAGLDWESAEPY